MASSPTNRRSCLFGKRRRSTRTARSTSSCGIRRGMRRRKTRLPTLAPRPPRMTWARRDQVRRFCLMKESTPRKQLARFRTLHPLRATKIGARPPNHGPGSVGPTGGASSTSGATSSPDTVLGVGRTASDKSFRPAKRNNPTSVSAPP